MTKQIPLTVKDFHGKDVGLVVDQEYVDWILDLYKNTNPEDLPAPYHLAAHLRQAWDEIERLKKEARFAYDPDPGGGLMSGHFARKYGEDGY